ncbi:hypothetical protein PG985_009960 [Apiospora marii]|uniref:Heterokaryon incompatibility domain-containing protein n=1 Tax=Apiospora marii TaxID=335849 RepID=A0ABR1RKH5_9PEZI
MGADILPLQLEVTGDEPACTVCLSIKKVLTSEEYCTEIDIRTIYNVLEKPCPGHDSLLRFLLLGLPKDQVSPDYPLKIYVRDNRGYRANLQLAGTDLIEWAWHQDYELILARGWGSQPTVGLGRALDTDWVDTGLLRDWVCECLVDHHHLCENPLNIAKASPAWLIDTTSNCIVVGRGIQDYVALSYRWGNAAHLQNETRILHELQAPGALLQARFTNLVSPTLKHAIGLTRVLGEQYLWADALCIVQDDGEQKSSQLQLMGAIYASAKLTIVAIDGDSNHGIPGLRGISNPRSLLQRRFSLGDTDQVFIRQNPQFKNAHGCSPYFGRAWTFQEYFLSKRCLIIGNNQFHWDCSCAAHHEDMHGPDQESHFRSRVFQFPKILSGIPDFSELSRLLEEYNSRDLTFPEDALAGITGLLEILGRSFEGGFIYGLAETCFESALMWHTKNDTPYIQRRSHSGKNHATLEGSQLPSWSWLGWKGAIWTHDENIGELDDHSPITKRITQWYSQETPTSSAKHAIASKYLEHDGGLRDCDSEVLLTKGWVKERFDASEHANPRYPNYRFVEKLGDYVYKHANLPQRLFWRPFPVKDFQLGMEGSLPQQHPFISCDTKRGWFGSKKCSTKVYPDKWPIPNSQVFILGKDQRCCGYLQLPSDAHAADFPAAELDSRTLELVAICIRKVRRNYRPLHVPWSKVRPPDYELYGVLWIGWNDGVAYRKGVGYIWRKDWENHDLEDFHLILG